ncbi:MAG: chemotaxis protein CheA [Clostridia bacterium]|nr:chemotaxis protein CheA [Clostridia bacterium]
MDFNVNEFLDAFIEETKDNLENFNETIMDLEKNKDDADLVNVCFRVAHTLKGMAGSMGFEKMRSLTHTMEDCLSDVRDGKLKVTTELINLLFKSHDFLDKCLESIIETSGENVDEPTQLIEDLKKAHSGELASEPDAAPAAPEPEAPKAEEAPAPAAEAPAEEVKEEKSFEENTKVQDVEMSFDVPDGANKDNCYKIDVTIDKDCKLLVARLFIITKTVGDEAKLLQSNPTLEQLSDMSFTTDNFKIEMYVETSDSKGLIEKINTVPEIENITCTSVANPSVTIEQAGERIDLDNFKAGDADPNAKHEEAASSAASGEHQAAAPAAAQGGAHHVEEYLKIAASKVDNLADMVSELMITQSLIEQRIMLLEKDDAILTKEIPRMSRLTKDIQNLSMSLRMVPLKSTLQKVIRTGRDTAQTLQKEINLAVIGEETEIDRTITEKLYTPLMHMIRNSIGHGIEDADTRKKAGKDPVGNVTISAYNKRGSVYIEIEDDGKGLDMDKILKKAIEKGIADKDKKYSDDEIANFIFLPGFSTADKVDAVSGRGVGMDVVKTDITKVGGTVRVDTHAGEGTKFTLKIPINLAIMNGTIVKIMDQTYILPTLNIREMVNVTEENWISVKGKEKMLKVRGEVLPIYPIKALLKDNGFSNPDDLVESGDYEDESLMVIVELDEMVRAIPVQTVLERREIVVKSLGSEFANLDFISGASILGDGTISLIFDIEGLLKKSAN